MDARPIGLFDSGLGGLTAARALEELLPGENLIYFGDSANAPYGVRSLPDLERLARANAAFLLRYDVKAILVACGTVSSTVLPSVRPACPVPMFDVVRPACARAAEAGFRRIAVAATEATIRSGAFDRQLRMECPGLQVFSKACQSLVVTVEQGHFRPGDKAAEAAVAAELEPVRAFGPQAVLLACTHFPLLQDQISAFLGDGVELISVGMEAARALRDYLQQNDLLAPRSRGEHRWFTSGSARDFGVLAEVFLGHSVRAEHARALSAGDCDG